MQSLRDRLNNLSNPTGSEIWDILKQSEDDLHQDLKETREEQQEVEKQTLIALQTLKSKKEELNLLKTRMHLLQDDYKAHIKSVEEGLKKNNLDFKQVTTLFEKILEESLEAKRLEVVELFQTIETKNFDTLNKAVTKIVEILKENITSGLRERLSDDINAFHKKASAVLRSALWSFLQKNKIPLQSINETVPMNNLTEFYKKIDVYCNFSCNLNYIVHGNNLNSIENVTSDFFGLLTNLCIDMIDDEKKDADFEWVLNCAHKWSNNLKEVVLVVISNLKISNKDNYDVDTIYNKQFVLFVHTIIKVFIFKNFSDPLVFSKISSVLRKFESNFSFDIQDEDLYKPFYEPEILNKWILLEVEIFTLGSTNLFSNDACFNKLSSCSIGNCDIKWASEVTLFFEEWLSRISKEMESIGNTQAQEAFYEATQVMMLDMCQRIHDTADRLYTEPSWADDVYLVMNTLWEIRNIIESLTLTWPISCMNVERQYEEEWHRLSGMIMEYLNDIMDDMDCSIRSSYTSDQEKLRKVSATFFRIIKCLTNATSKASKSSKNKLLNNMVAQLFLDIQHKFDKWQKESVDVLSSIYSGIYSNLIPHLDTLCERGIWEKNVDARREITQLDALMKVAANKDPSGELVRTAFKSIDEEQVIKMLAELNIHSTSDHAFQDYQILAENWDKLRDKTY